MERGNVWRSVWKIQAAPISSRKAVRAIIKSKIFFVFFHESRSSISPAITWLERPRLTNNETTKKVRVMSPSPPICSKHMIINCPSVEKSLKGTVKRPVTQVQEVAVKKASIRLMGRTWEKGRERKIVPKPIAIEIDKRIVRLGEKKCILV